MARHAPGLSLTDLENMTPEQTVVIRQELNGMLKVEAEARLEHTKAIVRASGARLI